MAYLPTSMALWLICTVNECLGYPFCKVPFLNWPGSPPLPGGPPAPPLKNERIAIATHKNPEKRRRTNFLGKQSGTIIPRIIKLPNFG